MSILVLHGSGPHRDQLVTTLQSQGFGPVYTCDSLGAFRRELAHAVVWKPGFQALIVDLAVDCALPACQYAAHDAALPPVLVLFDKVSASQLEEALQAGAVDCLSKPVNALELSPRLHKAIRKSQTSRATGQPVSAHLGADGSTGCGACDGRPFEDTLNRAWNRGRLLQSPLALIVINVDHLARYNQQYGRAAGDECIRRIRAALQEGIFRPDDIAVNRGCGEFAVILPATDRSGAATVAKRLRDQVLDLAIPHNGSPGGGYVTISLGLATVTPSFDMSPEDLMVSAERALSQAKLEGRNRLVVAEDVLATWLA
ncbi:MAG TPA: diguanylate cyclase [Bryobacteraceae bacterium]|nr:diguanylate cyclase [Bryobacteraceae bacterium]